MAARRRKTSSTSRKKTTAASRKKTTAARRTGGAAKRTTGARKTGARKTSGARKKTAGARKTSGARRKTSSAKKAAAGRKGGAKSASRRKTTRASAAKRTSAPRGAARRRLELRSLDDVLRDQLADLYSAEKQLVEALPKVASAASSPELREAFEHHLEETRGHVRRLDTIFGRLGAAQPDFCQGMHGLILEGEDVVEASGNSSAKDAALIAAAQRIEHYEIAAYGTARTLAAELDLGDTRDLLDETLDEESKADKLLTQLATGGRFRSGINEAAD